MWYTESSPSPTLPQSSSANYSIPQSSLTLNSVTQKADSGGSNCCFQKRNPYCFSLLKAPDPSCCCCTATVKLHSVLGTKSSPTATRAELGCFPRKRPWPSQPAAARLLGTSKLQSHSYSVFWGCPPLLLGAALRTRPMEILFVSLSKGCWVARVQALVSALHALWELGAIHSVVCSSGTVAIGATISGVTSTHCGTCRAAGPSLHSSASSWWLSVYDSWHKLHLPCETWVRTPLHLLP